MLLLSACWVPPSGYDTGAFAPQLTRAPYLTDLTTTSVTVNWATDRSATSASVVWSTSGGDGSDCALDRSQSATRTAITVNSVAEYQWKATLPLGQEGTYCYRVRLAGQDLMGTNPPMRFRTQVPAGSTASFSFAVVGDWGAVTNGQNPGQSGVMDAIAAASPRFVVTVGDNGYPNGNQTDFGDLQQTATSAVFGPSFWAKVGGPTPLFLTQGNHGLSGTTNAGLVDFPQDTVVGASSGRYRVDNYCCVNGTNAANYASVWYAFDAGQARFYVLDAAWGDTNAGSASVYANDAAAHWSPSSPEYQWLVADLAAHPDVLKFAFFHYPLYSDQSNVPSDTFLQGTSGLEGLLATNGVAIAFNGHAHVYQRNVPSYPGGLISYVTGGGGGDIQSIGSKGCSASDAYGIGWSDTHQRGSACGAAAPPASAANAYHFLLVTVAGRTVTVAPTDSQGATFDVRTYDF